MEGILNYARGVARELAHSKKLHSRYSAVLISSKVLRQRHLGQLDICSVDGQRLIVVEVKGYYGPGERQRRRLHAACQWLGDLLKKEISFYVVRCEGEFLP